MQNLSKNSRKKCEFLQKIAKNPTNFIKIPPKTVNSVKILQQTHFVKKMSVLPKYSKNTYFVDRVQKSCKFCPEIAKKPP